MEADDDQQQYLELPAHKLGCVEADDDQQQYLELPAHKLGCVAAQSQPMKHVPLLALLSTRRCPKFHALEIPM